MPASMWRPRPEDRGERNKDLARICRPCVSWLQCGHGPKTVESTHRQPVARVCGELVYAGLQCGHGPKTVENEGFKGSDATQGEQFAASMRPRPEDRGEPAMRNHRLPRMSTHLLGCFNAATAQRPWECDHGDGCS